MSFEVTPISSTKALRILLVDDEPVHLELTSAMLSRLGYEVYCALNCLEAALSMSHGIDCVVTDYHMPAMNGAEFIRRYRHNSRPRFILLTGDPSPSVCDDAIAAGAERVLEKPATLGELVNAIEHVCRNIPHTPPGRIAARKSA